MWAVAQTKPRQENKAEINLNNQGYTCYLPIIERKKFIHNTWTICKEVLFSNYIFIDLNSCKTSLSKINNTYGVSRLLINKDLSLPYTINEDFILDLKKILNKGINISTLKKGSKVSITSGKLSEFTAIFLEQCSKTRSKVLISMLNNDYVTTIDTCNLQRFYL